jgi:hypothetical protein
MADLNLAFQAYIATLRAAALTPDRDTTTVIAKDLATVRAAHPLPAEVDDLNTLYRIHLNG